jgi:NADH:ubiquinone oxidoreductase subunit 4 (subunit M)
VTKHFLLTVLPKLSNYTASIIIIIIIIIIIYHAKIALPVDMQQLQIWYEML